jgi:hypothetical protein
MKYREEFYQGFTDRIKEAGLGNLLGRYKLPAKAVSKKHLDHKDAFYDYLDGKLSKEEYDKLTQQFLSSDPALQPKQQMLPGFDDLFKESEYWQGLSSEQLAEKKAQLGKLLFKGKQLFHRSKNPLDMHHATLGDRAVYRIANLVSPRLGGKYRRHVQFKPHSYKDNLSPTGRSLDLRVVDSIDNVQDVMDTMGYFDNKPIKPSQQQVLSKLVDYVNNQKRMNQR